MTAILPLPDHGGDLDAAMARFGGTRADWLDLSTGINPVAYPAGHIPAHMWQTLPTHTDCAELERNAARAFGLTQESDVQCLALAGASAAIQLVPRLGPIAQTHGPERARTATGQASVPGPTYNEHARALRQSGWQVEVPTSVHAIKRCDLAVIVNPNNPDGRHMDIPALIGIAQRVGVLVIDESFADAHPDLSVLPHLAAFPETSQVLVLRSFGKFYGLAGMRLGFAIGPAELIDPMRQMAGPWAVNGPAIHVAQQAYRDIDWRKATQRRLTEDCQRMDALAEAANWTLIGGSLLFRTYQTQDAKAAQDALAMHRIWTRIFPYSASWMRLGLPADEDGWNRLRQALATL